MEKRTDQHIVDFGAMDVVSKGLPPPLPSLLCDDADADADVDVDVEIKVGVEVKVRVGVADDVVDDDKREELSVTTGSDEVVVSDVERIGGGIVARVVWAGVVCVAADGVVVV